MLESLRKAAGTWLAKILFGLLILSFGVWGVGDVIRGGAEDVPAIVVGDVEIGPTAVRQRFDQQVQQLRQVFGESLTAETARQMGMLESTIQALVAQATIDMAARDLRLYVTDEALREQILETPAFQGSDGRFDRALFQRVLSANNLTEAQYLSILRTELTRERLVDGVAAAGAAPAPLVDALFRHREERRVAEVLAIDPSQITITAEPAPEQLQALYQENIDRFTAPEYRSFTAVTLQTEEMAERVEVTDQEIADYYEANRDLYTVPERRAVSQVLVDDLAIAQQIAQAAQGDASLSEAAEAAGAPPVIDLGPVSPDSLPPAAADPVFALDEGQVSDPVESPLGWHVFQVNEVVPGTQRPLDEVRDQIRQNIASERAIDVLYEESAALQDALGGGATLEEAAEQLGLTLIQVPPVDRQGRTPDGTQADIQTPLRDDILTTAFRVDETDDSGLEESAGGYYIVRTDQVIPAAPRPFEAVEADVRQLWLEQARQQAAEELATQLQQALQGGADPAALAAENPAASFAVHPPVTREGELPQDAPDAAALPRAAVQALFGLQPGEAAAVPHGDGALALRLREVVPAADNPEAREEVAASLRRSMGDDVLVQTTKAFGDRYGVEVNRSAIERAF